MRLGQEAENACTACVFPHLSMLQHGPKCTLRPHWLFRLILWGLYTAMPWQCVPIPPDAHGKPVIYSTHV